MWLEISLVCQKVDAAALEALFTELGAVSVSLFDAGDQPLLEPGPGETPLWGSIRLVGLFAGDTDLDHVRFELLGRLDPGVAATLSVQALEDRDWVRAWMDDFHPMSFGSRLWICPSHCPVADATAVNVILDPGLAFGSGTHATTGLCLQWLDGHDLSGKSVIDYGCGSGILAIAALKLGAAEAWAVDIDEQALIATRENARRNGVLEHLQVGQPDRLPAQRCQVLLANILANPLITLAPGLAQRVVPGGRLVLSGILADQAAAVRQAYQPWFDMAEPRIQSGWTLLTGSRRPDSGTASYA